VVAGIGAAVGGYAPAAAALASNPVHVVAAAVSAAGFWLTARDLTQRRRRGGLAAAVALVAPLALGAIGGMPVTVPLVVTAAVGVALLTSVWRELR
jgi:hypothetical protein